MELLQKLQHLEENIKLLKEIKKSITLDDLNSHKRHEWEVRYGLFESIQIVIDISCKISSIYNLGNPKSYKECVELLRDKNYLSKELSSKVISMVGLRNILVDEYVQIDNEKLYEYLHYLDDFTKFAKEIESNI